MRSLFEVSQYNKYEIDSACNVVISAEYHHFCMCGFTLLKALNEKLINQFLRFQNIYTYICTQMKIYANFKSNQSSEERKLFRWCFFCNLYVTISLYISINVSKIFTLTSFSDKVLLFRNIRCIVIGAHKLDVHVK